MQVKEKQKILLLPPSHVPTPLKQQQQHPNFPIFPQTEEFGCLYHNHTQVAEIPHMMLQHNDSV
jgi:hypothetical protein